ncbi:MAG: ribonuclease activity regulator RraA [Dehalococcoidia bacterium]
MGDPENIAVSPATLEKLKKASTATITMQLFKRGIRQAFLVNVRPMNPDAAKFAGDAYTMRFVPSREDLESSEAASEHSQLQFKGIESIQPGQVMVVDSREDIRAASMGHMLVTRLMHRGAAGVVTDGAYRDGPAISETPFPAYARAMTASSRLSFFNIADLQVPIGCAGVVVYPGDIVVGDAEGVVVIPRHMATEIAEDAYEQEELETFLFTKLEKGLPIWGVYPHPNEETMMEYQEWRKARQ